MDQGKPTVLYVDDVSMNLKLFQAALKKEYEIILTESPVEALNILDNKEIQVLVSDQRMPDMSGTELLEIVAKKHPDIRRFMLTAYTDLETVVEAVNVGRVHGYVKKPLNAEEIKQAINNSLETYHLRKKNVQILQELENANRELRNLDGLKSEIINSINSEIRNPLNRIMGTLQLLKAKTEGDELSEVVDILDQSVVRLEHFYTLTKQITLLNSPGFEIEKEKISCKQLIQFASIETSEELKEKGLGISWDQSTSDLNINGDNGLLVNCLVNLIRFASEHTEKDGEIRILLAGEENLQSCSVIDQGRNYSESQQEILMELYSGDHAQMSLSMGIGIAVSRMIMEAHGGSLEYVKEKEGRGRIKMLFPDE